MSAVAYPAVVEPYDYRGHLVSVHLIQPDLIARVDGADLPNFYLNTTAARAAAERYVDNVEREQENTA